MKERKIYFMHIPKTAGSAFNSIFKSAVPEGRHFEHMESNGERFAEIKVDGAPFYASGHFTYSATRDLITRSDVFSITILRNPVSQLISHLKWVKAYGNPESEARRANLPAEIAQLSLELWNVSLNDVRVLQKILERPVARRLFDNVQVRYMTSMDDEPVGRSKVEEAKKNFREFDFLFVLDDIENAIKYIKKNIPEIANIQRENSALFKEEVNLCDREILDFYRVYVQYDAALYTEVRSYSRERFFDLPFKPAMPKEAGCQRL